MNTKLNVINYSELVFYKTINHAFLSALTYNLENINQFV